VHRLTRHLRGLLVALAALALSAGVVLAARPTSVEAPAAVATDGLTVAAEAAGKTVPVRVEAPTLPVVAKDPDGDEDEAAPEVDEDATEAAAPAAEGERAQNHGWFVSQAAQGVIPATAGNRGAYVSDIAQGDQGKPAAATAAREAKAAKAPKAPKTEGQ
jgi:hypothetical protein